PLAVTRPARAPMPSSHALENVAGDAHDSEPPPPSRAPASSAHLTRSVRVLAVDDDAVNLAVLKGYLEGARFSVTTAPSGALALAAMKVKGPFDVVLLDVMMPKMTGYEVCAAMRERHRANELPILLLTAKNQVADVVQGFEVGANDYLTKPFEKQELL